MHHATNFKQRKACCCSLQAIFSFFIFFSSGWMDIDQVDLEALSLKDAADDCYNARGKNQVKCVVKRYMTTMKMTKANKRARRFLEMEDVDGTREGVFLCGCLNMVG